MLVPRTERHKLQVKQQCAPEIRERRVNDGMKQNESMQRKGLTHKSSNVRARERRRKVILWVLPCVYVLSTTTCCEICVYVRHLFSVLPKRNKPLIDCSDLRTTCTRERRVNMWVLLTTKLPACVSFDIVLNLYVFTVYVLLHVHLFIDIRLIIGMTQTFMTLYWCNILSDFLHILS